MNPEERSWLDRAKRFEVAAHGLLGQHEGSRPSRVMVIEGTYSNLEGLNLKQDDLIRQSLRCAEFGFYRAAHVMAWAGCMDFIQEKISEDGLIALRSIRPKWQGRDISEIAEWVPERQLVEVLRDLGLATKNEVAALVGLLQRRNECAHPSDYLPQINETLGYLAEMLQRIKALQAKSIQLPS